MKVVITLVLGVLICLYIQSIGLESVTGGLTLDSLLFGCLSLRVNRCFAKQGVSYPVLSRGASYYIKDGLLLSCDVVPALQDGSASASSSVPSSAQGNQTSTVFSGPSGLSIARGANLLATQPTKKSYCSLHGRSARHVSNALFGLIGKDAVNAVKFYSSKVSNSSSVPNLPLVVPELTSLRPE